ncbi:mitochondrial carrier domain-containing protein [Suillus subluteus]|nr:mitochondrial carrier domain-containing protein [Suillus subluteus]
MSLHQPSFFPTTALDHAAAGLGAGVVAVLCMHPLDLLKVKLQLQYVEKRASGDDPNYRMSPGAYLLCSAQASSPFRFLLCGTAIMTNPIWVVKVRMFTTRADSPTSYRSLSDGIASIWKHEGFAGLWKGTSLALVGVSNGAVQFMAYEEMKRWGFEQKRKRFAKAGKVMGPEDDKLSNTSYTLMSGASKLWALALTYPYQVIRSRIQNNATTHLYPDISTTIKRTWQGERIRGFYRGMGTNLVRVLPGTCVTFVVYENLAWLLRTSAARREAKRRTQLPRRIESTKIS